MAEPKLRQPAPPAPPLADDEPIVAVDFTPLGAERKRRGLKLSPVRIAIGAALVVFVAAGWFVLTARSVFFDVTPVTSAVSVAGPLAVRVGPRYLMRSGAADVSIRAEGYYDFDQTLTIGDDQAQTFAIELVPLPGFLDLDTGNVVAAEVFVDGEAVGVTPLRQLELAAGEHTLTVRKDRYETLETSLVIEGRSTSQTLALELLPAWANISFATTPAGATVSIDGVDVGQTPLTSQVLAGAHEVLVKLPAHKAWTDTLEVTARSDQNLPPITLEPADGLVLLRSTPSNASVTVDGVYQGQTPLELTLPPEQNHQLVFFLNGYQEARRQVRTSPDAESAVTVALDPILSSVQISATPADAELYVNGVLRGNANQSIELLAASQTIEVRREGYVPYTTTFISRPGLEQQLAVELKSLEQQRIEAIKTEITTVTDQKLKLIYPGPFTMGASRREAGRQANEVIRNVNLTKPFYLSLTEVTNEQFAAFDAEHSSGVVEGRTLSNANQPVVRVSWEQAARYSNWLSEQEGLPPYYQVEGDNTVTGINPDSNGYRLPTEAEWEWAARVAGDASSLLRFPWGAELPPPDNQGNYADISAGSFLGRIIVNYNDGFMGSAPVGSFAPNANGFFDMGGNVAEWVHDYYGTAGVVGTAEETDPLGPGSGSYHVIRGSSWAHGTVTELRLSFRDYNNAPRDDVGFRVARYLGEP
jgi:formylglycine-generating enzyme required for sulfatase activity